MSTREPGQSKDAIDAAIISAAVVGGIFTVTTLAGCKHTEAPALGGIVNAPELVGSGALAAFTLLLIVCAIVGARK